MKFNNGFFILSIVLWHMIRQTLIPLVPSQSLHICLTKLKGLKIIQLYYSSLHLHLSYLVLFSQQNMIPSNGQFHRDNYRVCNHQILQSHFQNKSELWTMVKIQQQQKALLLDKLIFVIIGEKRFLLPWSWQWWVC